MIISVCIHSRANKPRLNFVPKFWKNVSFSYACPSAATLESIIQHIVSVSTRDRMFLVPTLNGFGRGI